MRPPIRFASLAIALLLLSAIPASAQLVNSFQVGGGWFFPRGIDNRISDDVLVRNFFGVPVDQFPGKTDALAFQMNDFIGGRVFGEWNLGIGRHIEVGTGVGYYRQTVPTVYRDLVDLDFREIEQQMRLETIPITVHVRFMPFGSPGHVQPYVGAGLSLLNYHYSESGSFVDNDTLEVFTGTSSKRGITPGVMLLGGVRVPIKGDVYALGIEARYTFGNGDITGTDTNFPADKIDLSGTDLNFSFMVRF